MAISSTTTGSAQVQRAQLARSKNQVGPSSRVGEGAGGMSSGMAPGTGASVGWDGRRDTPVGSRLGENPNTRQGNPTGGQPRQKGEPGPAGKSESRQQKALALAKQLATAQRDRNKPLVDQAVGAAGARGGQALGGTIGSAIPGIGTAAGSAIGKRVGRILGENWKKTILIAVVIILCNLALLLLPVIIMIVLLVPILDSFGLL